MTLGSKKSKQLGTTGKTNSAIYILVIELKVLFAFTASHKNISN